MEYFEKYVSNTTAGSGNQSWFAPENPQEKQTAIVFYKLTVPGELTYSLLYSNTIDSTFADGTHSHCNLVCDEWTLHSLRLAMCDSIDVNAAQSWVPVTFDGSPSKTVHPGELFATDAIKLCGSSYLAVEITFSGKVLPHHPESILSGYVKKDGKYEESTLFPYPSMIGVERQVKHRIGFWGDSITQGIGTEKDSYTHWNAVAASLLGNDYSYWNLGLGYARAKDAATGGAWFFKARQVDTVIVCLGVNDLYHDGGKEAIKSSLRTIVRELSESGVRVILQTLPPFDYRGETLSDWREINVMIKTELADKCALVFDNVPILGDDAPNEGNTTRFGGHPNALGCRLWGEALAKAVKPLLP